MDLRFLNNLPFTQTDLDRIRDWSLGESPTTQAVVRALIENDRAVRVNGGKALTEALDESEVELEGLRDQVYDLEQQRVNLREALMTIRETIEGVL